MSKAPTILTMDVVRAHREEILRVAAQFGAVNVRVFGSVARGEGDERSDLDVLVDIVNEAEGFAYFGILEDLRRALETIVGRDVHVVDERGLRRLRERISRDAVPL